MRTLAILTAAVVMTGCASSSSGTYVSQEQFRPITVGTTTKAEVIEQLGAPTSTSFGTMPEGGVEMIGYEATKASVDAASYIPFVGMLFGGASGESTSAQFAFDENGVLTWHNYSTAGTDLNTGLLNRGN